MQSNPTHQKPIFHFNRKDATNPQKDAVKTTLTLAIIAIKLCAIAVKVKHRLWLVGC